MVLINDKKFSCATCIKGHRSSSCTHTERPLYEIKRKGRPVTQCEHCRNLRKTKQLHVRCECASKGPQPSLAGPARTHSLADETRKGVPGPTATFPRGFKDVHEEHMAAETLHALAGNGPDPDANRAARLDAILNPATFSAIEDVDMCQCMNGGPCTCCTESVPKATTSGAGVKKKSGCCSKGHPQPDPEVSHPILLPPPSSSSAPPSIFVPTRNNSTENLAEMFASKASTTSTASGGGGLVAPLIAASRASGSGSGASSCCATPASGSSSLAPPSMYHQAAHTSPHVHKTKLYSPYDKNLGSGADLSRRPSVPKSRSSGVSATGSGGPLTRTYAPPTSLPTIRDAARDTNLNVSFMVFPTDRPLVLSGCTCTDDCQCPGCGIHDNKKPAIADQQSASHQRGSATSQSGGACPTRCDSCFDCRTRYELPPGVQNADELRQIAQREMPLHATPPPDFSQILHEPEVPMWADPSDSAACKCSGNACGCSAGAGGSSGSGGRGCCGGGGDMAGPSHVAASAPQSGYNSDATASQRPDTLRKNSSGTSSHKRDLGRRSSQGKTTPGPRPILPRPQGSSEHELPPLSLIHRSNGHEHPVTIPHAPGASRASPISPPLRQHAAPQIFDVPQNNQSSVASSSQLPLEAPSASYTVSTASSDIEGSVEDWINASYPDPSAALSTSAALDPDFLERDMSPRLLQSMLQQILNEAEPDPPPDPQLSPNTKAILQSVESDPVPWDWNLRSAAS